MILKKYGVALLLRRWFYPCKDILLEGLDKLDVTMNWNVFVWFHALFEYTKKNYAVINWKLQGRKILSS